MDCSFTSFEDEKLQGVHIETPVAPGNVIIVDDIKLDANRHRVWQGNFEITLTTKGFQILQVLMSNPGFVMTRDALLDAVWGEDTRVCHRTVDAAVKRLRDGFSSGHRCNPIRTVRGVGYAFDETYSST